MAIINPSISRWRRGQRWRYCFSYDFSISLFSILFLLLMFTPCWLIIKVNFLELKHRWIEIEFVSRKKKMHFCHLYLRSDSFDHGRRRGCGWRCKLRALPLGSTPVTTNHRYRCTTLRYSVTRLGAISPFRGLPFSKMYLDHADQMPKLIFRPRVSTFMEWRWCRPWSQCCISS